MDFEEIKTKKTEELKEILANLRDELRELKFKAHSRQLKQHHKIDDLKKTVARICMVLKSDKK